MTELQLKHYLKGGLFEAIYDPKKTLDINEVCLNLIGKKLEVYQNTIITPLISPIEYVGQHAFNSRLIHGWFPEEDIENLIEIDSFIDYPESLPQYMYRLYYTEKDQLRSNFGLEDFKLPLIIGREYSSNMDDYIIDLSNPQATKIETVIWQGKYKEKLNWKSLALI